MALFGSKSPLCQYCQSPYCSGQCMTQAHADAQLAKYHQVMAQQMQNLPGLSSMFGQQSQQISKAPEVRKSLPEEEVICATGGIIGWRSWRVPCFGSELLSFNGAVWPVRAPLRAICTNGPTNCTGARCSCGLYAWKKREFLTVNANEYSSIEGEVWLWGKVIDCEKGYRAEFAYPKSFINSADARRIATIYGVETL